MQFVWDYYPQYYTQPHDVLDRLFNEARRIASDVKNFKQAEKNLEQARTQTNTS